MKKESNPPPPDGLKRPPPPPAPPSKRVSGHERVVSCDFPFYDGKGNEIKEFDVVKVFHFTGKRRKRHYMYKWIRKNGNGELCLMHLTNALDDLVPLKVVSKMAAAAYIWPDSEIVQSYS